MSNGGITGTVVDIRLLLSAALKTAATGIIIGNNHPSGNLKPSEPDKELTNKIKKASEYMDIKLLDHLIIAPEEKYLSFREDGLL
jgi:DNA repair protein RadC